MLSYNLDFNSCAIRDGFRKSSHIYIYIYIDYLYLASVSPFNLSFFSLLSYCKTKAGVSRNG